MGFVGFNYQWLYRFRQDTQGSKARRCPLKMIAPCSGNRYRFCSAPVVRFLSCTPPRVQDPDRPALILERGAYRTRQLQFATTTSYTDSMRNIYCTRASVI